MILESDKIDSTCIHSLVSEKVLAVRVKQFIHADLAKKLAGKVLVAGYRH